MKKCLIFLVPLMIILFSLSGCSKDNSNTPTVDNTATEIIGVWGKGNYFVSFAANGSYKAYLGDYFMDSGTYTYVNGTISCINGYSSINTTFRILSIDVTGGQLYLLANYMESKNNTTVSDTLKLTKEQEDGYQMNNSYIGTTHYGLKIDKNKDECSGHFYFQSSYFMTVSINGYDDKTHAETWNYCYIAPYIYDKRYTTEPLNMSNADCNTGKVFKDSVYIDNSDEYVGDTPHWIIFKNCN
jgi:hypothetical protein